MFHIGWFLGNGFSVQEWPAQHPEYDWTKPGLYQEMARRLEAGGFDMLILEDTSMVGDVYGGSSERYLSHALFVPKLDPAPLVPLIAAATNHIGVVPTLTTTYYRPYLVARLMATLDHLCDGRVGWNVVTGVSSISAHNYGLPDLPAHDTRYDMADEFVDICKGLWNTWEPDAVVMDYEKEVFADHTKVHRLDYVGKYHSSRGPLNIQPSPQGRPALIQAGASARGREFAARHADAILTHGRSLEGMKAYRDDVHSRMAKYGRKPSEVKVLFLCAPIIGETEEEAKEKHRQMTTVTETKVLNRLATISLTTGLDLAKYSLDEPLPDVEVAGEQTVMSRFLDGKPRPTVRQVVESMVQQTPGIPLIGTPDQIAEKMGEAMEYVGGDGFLIDGHFNPPVVAEVVEKLVPSLRERGLIRQGYSRETLRGHLQEF